MEVGQRILQEVAVYQVVAQFGIVRLEVLHRLLVQLDDGELRELALQQVLGEYAHARPDLQHVRVGGEHRLRDVLRDGLVVQEVLSQPLLRLHCGISVSHKLQSFYFLRLRNLHSLKPSAKIHNSSDIVFCMENNVYLRR